MASCVVGVWHDGLDAEDKRAFKRAAVDRSRADLFGAICAASGGRPFGLTALKDHLNARCVCD